MSTHIADEDLVEYLDGTLANGAESAVGQHLSTCTDCRARLADLAQFDTFVQSHAPADELTAAAMFEVGERVLAAGPAPKGMRAGLWGLLLAAVVLLGVSVWFAQGERDLGLRVVRYVPDSALRAAPPERFHLDAVLPQAGFVVVLARRPDGGVVRLPLDEGEGVVPAGAVRLPHHELLDWEHPADQLPREVLLAVFAAPPGAVEIQLLQQQWAKCGAGEVPAADAGTWRFVQRVDFPPAQR
jgi:hypothetical protein